MEMVKKEIQKIIETDLKNRRIMVIGRIEHIRLIIREVRKRYKVDYILDNDPNKQGKVVDDIPVGAPGDLLVPFDDSIFILIYSPKYWEEMLQQFKSYGYREGRHICVVDRPGKEKNVLKIKQGLQLYRNFRNKYGKDVRVFLANCPLGDYYLLALYFEEYITRRGITNYVITGTSQGITKLAYLMGNERNTIISMEESDSLIMAWRFLGEKYIAVTPLTIWQGAFRFNPCVTRQTETFTFMDTFKKMVYNLPTEVSPKFVEPKCHESVFWGKEHLHPRKTVLLVPYAYSIQTLSNGFWCELAQKIKGMGYDIIVNVGNQKEENFIPDTVSVCVDFMEIMSVMEMAGTVIGIRSGFFDITCKAACRRIILYPPRQEQNATWNRTDITFCSLKNMGLCADAVELEIESEGKLVEKIVNLLDTKL